MHIGVGACVEEGVKKVQVKFSGLSGISEITIALNMQKFDHFRGLGGISEFTIALNMQKFDHFRDLACILGSLGNDCIKIENITISCLKKYSEVCRSFQFLIFH